MILLGHPFDHVIPGPAEADGSAWCETCQAFVRAEDEDAPGPSAQVDLEDDNVGVSVGWRFKL